MPGFITDYFKALRKEQKGKLSVKKSMLKHPTLWLITFVAITAFFIFAIYFWATYVPPPSIAEPTMTIGGFINELTTVQNSFWIWVFIFLFLWFTKW